MEFLPFLLGGFICTACIFSMTGFLIEYKPYPITRMSSTFPDRKKKRCDVLFDLVWLWPYTVFYLTVCIPLKLLWNAKPVKTFREWMNGEIE